jgi:1-acyl-sn-glycerol-3-phosphate acyltransferase
MKITLKSSGIFFLLTSFFFTAAVANLLPVTARIKRRLAIHIVSVFSRFFLVVLGVRIHVKHRERFQSGGKGQLIISNHLTYVDILILSSLAPSAFITSVELKNTPLLGTLAKFGGSIFVERRRAAGLKQEINSVASALKQGFSVVLFPEGTTSNGDRVMQFKNSLFDAAIAAQTTLVPVCLRYIKINDEPLSPDNRDDIFYYGSSTFFQHAPRLLAQKSVDVEVRPLNVIPIRTHHSRKDLAAITHCAISEAYNK